MNNSSIVSIIIPVYNREKTICRAVKSVINQQYTNWELIIVDDRSKDNLDKIVEPFLEEDSRIRLIRNKYRRGAGSARNFGMKQAKGSYIAFLDSDDEWLPEHLLECITAMKAENTEIGYGLWLNNLGGITKDNFHHSLYLSMMLKELQPQSKNNYYILNSHFNEYVTIRGFFLLKISTFVFKKDLLFQTGNFDSRLKTAEDVDFFFRMLTGKKVIMINKIHAIVYQGNDNLFFYEESTQAHSNTQKKQRKHQFNELFCLIKTQRYIRGSKDFRFKELMHRTNFRKVAGVFGILMKSYKDDSPIKYWVCRKLKNSYDRKYLKYPSNNFKDFYLEFRDTRTATIERNTRNSTIKKPESSIV